MTVSKKMGRIIVSLPKSEIKYIDGLCKRFDMTRSEMVHECLERSLGVIETLGELTLKRENLKALSDAVYNGVWEAIVPFLEKNADNAHRVSLKS